MILEGLRNFVGGGGVEPPKTPSLLGTPLAAGSIVKYIINKLGCLRHCIGVAFVNGRRELKQSNYPDEP